MIPLVVSFGVLVLNFPSISAMCSLLLTSIYYFNIFIFAPVSVYVVRHRLASHVIASQKTVLLGSSPASSKSSLGKESIKRHEDQLTVTFLTLLLKKYNGLSEVTTHIQHTHSHDTSSSKRSEKP